MKILFAIIFIGVIATAPAQETNATATVDPMSFEAFKVIAQRNIFDPNRSARNGARPPEERPKRTEMFTLVGAIAYEKGEFAFFEGTSSEYRKSVKSGDNFAGYKVTQVTPKGVHLEAEGKSVQLPVGSQMKRLEGEEWKINTQARRLNASNPPMGAASRANPMRTGIAGTVATAIDGTSASRVTRANMDAADQRKAARLEAPPLRAAAIIPAAAIRMKLYGG
jgi:hypothetical protein